MSIFQLPSPTKEIKHHPGIDLGLKLYIKRDDLIHPEISGNKWRKLKYNIEEAKKLGAKRLITAGGAWSNHLAATAAAGQLLGFETIGFVRGEEPQSWSNTLHFCKDQGMKLIFISRKEFDLMPKTIDQLMLDFMDAYFIPLGGENDLGMKGCKEIVSEIKTDFDFLSVSVGTGTTLTGITESLEGKKILGFSALKEESQHSSKFLQYVHNHPQVELIYDYSLGGFAKSSKILENFIVEFYQQNKIMLEPVYTGKMMLGIFDLMEKGRFEEGSSIICIHTGGLQGLNGFPDLHRRLFTS